MIQSFRHKGLRQFYESGSLAGIQPAHAKRLRMQLAALSFASRTWKESSLSCGTSTTKILLQHTEIVYPETIVTLDQLWYYVERTFLGDPTVLSLENDSSITSYELVNPTKL